MIVFATEVNDCVNFDHLPRKCPTTTVPTMLLILLVLTLSSMQGFRYPLYKNSFESSIFTRLPCSRTCAAVLPTMGAPDMKYLYTIHNSAVPVESAVAFIQSWAYTQAQTGSIISANNGTRGVSFFLRSSTDKPFLEVIAVQDGTDVRIQSVVNRESVDFIATSSRQLQPLITLATENLIDSIRHEIGSLIVGAPHADKQRENGAISSDQRTAKPQTNERSDEYRHVRTPREDQQDTVQNAVKSSDAVPQQDSQHHSAEKIVYHWQGSASGAVNPAPVVAAVQTWCRKFANKGTGLEATHLSDGVQLTLGVSDTDEGVLQLRVRSQLDGGVAVTSTLIHAAGTGTADWYTDEVDTRVSELTEGLPEQSTGSGLVQTAAVNLEASLAKELASLIVERTNDALPTAAASEIRSQHFTMGTVEMDVTTDSVPVMHQIPVDDAVSVSQALRVVEAAAAHAQCSDIPFTSSPPHQSIQGSVGGGGQVHVPQREAPSKRRDPATMQKAAQMGLRLENFEGKGLEDQAMQELNNMLRNSRSEGFLTVIKSYERNATATASTQDSVDNRANNQAFSAPESSSSSLEELFEKGKQHSALSLQEILNRPTLGETVEELRQPTTQMPMYLSDSSLKDGGIDIFQSPAELYADPSGQSAQSESQLPLSPHSHLAESEKTSHFPPDPANFDLDKQRLSVLLIELARNAPEIQDSVVDSYRDLLLSENFLFLLRDANATTVDWDTRQLFKKITEKSIALTAELAALVKTESVRHLQTIEDVCEIAADFQQDDLKFLERMHYIKPRFDTSLLAFLTYAVGEEMTRLTLRGVDPTLAPSDWLKVLRVVKQGVLAEFESRYAQLLEPLLLVVRFEDSDIRSAVFERFVNVTPAMELPYMKALAQNMISNILQRSAETGQRSESPGNVVTQKVFSTPLNAEPLPDAEVLVPRFLALLADVDRYLSDEIIAQRVEAFRAQAEAQGQSVEVRHRNPVMQAEMETAQQLQREADRGRRLGETGLLGDGHM